MANKESSRTSCRFLHHWKWAWVEVPDRWPNGSSDGKGGGYWRKNCLFCGAASHQTAPEPPFEASPNPTEKAGVSPSTGTPVPSIGP
jgi:hypothetical protein